MAKRFPTIVTINVTEYDIKHGICGNARNCMIGLAVQRRLGLVHGYVKVDTSGVAITRRDDYREKAELPPKVRDALCTHDECKRQGLDPLEWIKPFSVDLKFRKTTKIAPKATRERKDQINDARRQRKLDGKPDKKSHKRDRMAGINLTPRLAERLRRLRASA